VSTQQLHRALGVSLKSTWFLIHRIREALRKAALHLRRLGAKARRSRLTKLTSAARKRISTHQPANTSEPAALVRKLSLPWSSAAVSNFLLNAFVYLVNLRMDILIVKI